MKVMKEDNVPTGIDLIENQFSIAASLNMVFFGSWQVMWLIVQLHFMFSCRRSRVWFSVENTTDCFFYPF